MSKSSRRNLQRAGMAVVGALLVGGSANAVPTTQPTGRPADLVTVKGRGGGTLSLPHFEGDRIKIRLRGHTEADQPVGVTGTFAVTHVAEDGTVLADFRGTMDCLMAGGEVAVATGIITRGSAPGLPGDQELVGHRVGFTVSDHGHRDRIGWSWLVMGFHDVEGCTSTAPFFPVTTGHFSVTAPD